MFIASFASKSRWISLSLSKTDRRASCFSQNTKQGIPSLGDLGLPGAMPESNPLSIVEQFGLVFALWTQSRK